MDYARTQILNSTVKTTKSILGSSWGLILLKSKLKERNPGEGERPDQGRPASSSRAAVSQQRKHHLLAHHSHPWNKPSRGCRRREGTASGFRETMGWPSTSLQLEREQRLPAEARACWPKQLWRSSYRQALTDLVSLVPRRFSSQSFHFK